jgi:hypothetical protein
MDPSGQSEASFWSLGAIVAGSVVGGFVGGGSFVVGAGMFTNASAGGAAGPTGAEIVDAAGTGSGAGSADDGVDDVVVVRPSRIGRAGTDGARREMATDGDVTGVSAVAVGVSANEVICCTTRLPPAVRLTPMQDANTMPTNAMRTTVPQMWPLLFSAAAFVARSSVVVCAPFSDGSLSPAMSKSLGNRQ